MSRLLAALRWDVRIQFRQGFYYAALFVIALWVLLLSQLPGAASMLFLPFIIFFDLSVFGFYFMAGTLFLEKGEGVLEALVVTPLRTREYLLSKTLSLTVLALLVSIVVVLLVHGPVLNWLSLLAGVALNSWFLILAGFIVAARYDAVNEFLIPSILYVVPTQLPALWYFGIWDHWLLYLVPTMPAMLLIAGAFEPIAPWQILYSLVYLSAACLVVTYWAERAFRRFVVRSEGGG
jgi:fluoroquinolone transport system permease protein